MEPVIQARGLSKHFRTPVKKTGRFAALRTLFSLERETKIAVDAISMTVQKGEIVGYVGPNGAGKSTTIKMLTGILLPTAGEVTVLGLNPHAQRKQLVRRLGVVFGQKTQLWWDVPVIESLRLLKAIYKIPDPVYQRNMALFDDLLDLHAFQHTPVRQLSLGQRMRADLAAALLHDPDILLLDEPTIGVDVVAKERFRSFMRELNRERDVTILLTTHDMSDIEKVCERMLIIDRGTIIYDGGLTALKEQLAPERTLVVDFNEDVEGLETAHAELVAYKNRRARFRFDRRAISASELIVELAGRYPVRDIGVEEPDIEAIVRDIYKESSEKDKT